MAILDRLARRSAMRSVSRRSNWRDPDDLMFEWFAGGLKSVAGERVNASTAMQVAAYFAAIRCISEDEAKLPLPVYKRLGNKGKEKQPQHPVHKLLNRAPNQDMTSISFRQTALHHALGWGSGYAHIQRDTNNGAPMNLWPLDPTSVTPQYNDRMELEYRINNADGTRRIIASIDMFHLPGLSFNGISGYSAARYGKESLGLAMAEQRSAAALFGQGSMPSGIVTHPGTMDDLAFDRFKKEWKATHGGGASTHWDTAILEGGATWAPTTTPHKDSQWIESRYFSIEEIARWFRMPPHKLQHLLRATFSNIHDQNIEYVVDTLTPWLVRLEQEVHRKLFTKYEQDTLFVEHTTAALLRGDPVTRNNAYEIMRRNGVLNANEWRAMENMNPIGAQGNIYTVQSAVIPLEDVGKNFDTEPKPVEPKEPTGPAPTTEPEPTEEKAQNTPDRLSAVGLHWRGQLQTVYQQILTMEAGKITRAAKKTDFEDRLDAVYADLHVTIRRHLADSVDGFVQLAWLTFGNGELPRPLLDLAASRAEAMATEHIRTSRAELAGMTEITPTAAMWRSDRTYRVADADMRVLVDLIRSNVELN